MFSDRDAASSSSTFQPRTLLLAEMAPKALEPSLWDSFDVTLFENRVSELAGTAEEALGNLDRTLRAGPGHDLVRQLRELDSGAPYKHVTTDIDLFEGLRRVCLTRPNMDALKDSELLAHSLRAIQKLLRSTIQIEMSPESIKILSQFDPGISEDDAVLNPGICLEAVARKLQVVAFKATFPIMKRTFALFANRDMRALWGVVDPPHVVGEIDDEEKTRPVAGTDVPGSDRKSVV